MNTPILNMLLDYAKLDTTRMHMPGHKGLMPNFNEIVSIDLTELNFTDSLHTPKGVILEAQQLFAKLYGCNYSHFMVNGSSGGILAMIKCMDGDFLIGSNSHQAVFNGLQMFHDRYFVVDNEIIDGKIRPITLAQVKSSVEENPTIKVVLLTSPNYYGDSCDVAAIYSYLKSKKIKFFVDSAHGAAFGLSKHLPESVIKNCDLCVMSTHKTLPAFTQTAVVLVNDKELSIRFKRALNSLTTTSPSYILLASIDYARYLAEEQAAQRFDDLFITLKEFREKCKKLKVVIEESDDFSRIVINGRKMGLTGSQLYKQLQENGVVCEMYNMTSVVCILSFLDNSETVNRLYEALCKVVGTDKIIETPTVQFKGCQLIINDPIKETEFIDLADSLGRKLATNVGIIPPCVPLGSRGEIVSQELIDTLLANIKMTYNVFDGKIEVASIA